MAKLLGTEGNDTLIGTQEADTLSALTGNDTVWGLGGFDWIEGNLGNDNIWGNQGNDTAIGGEGNDLIYGGLDNDQIFGGVDEDTLFGDLGNDSIWGGKGRDILFGLQGDDFLAGDASDDRIYGNQGNDTIVGGEGNDVLYGGKNNDLIKGELGNDFLYGDKGSDTLTGGDGNDIFFLGKETGGATLAEADIITDFADNSDLLGLSQGLNFEDLTIFQGTGANVADTIIQDATNGKFLAALVGINRTTIDRSDFFPQVTLRNPMPSPRRGSRFGHSVAFVGNNLLVGEPAEFVPVRDPGAAYLFDRTSGTVLQTFRNPTPSGFDEFGFSAAAVGNNVLIGAPRDRNPGAPNIGGAYLFDSTTGALLQTFRNPTTESSVGFGASTAAVGNNVLIGGSNEAAYLFDSTTGALLQTFRNPKPDRLFGSFGFGNSVAAAGNNVLIGAISDGGTPFLSTDTGGVAYLFDSLTGTLLQTFSNPTPKPGDLFGSSVAAVGDKILIGAPEDDAIANNAGAAYLFDSSTGTLLQTFFDPTPNNGDRFGFAVTTEGNNFLIGSPGSGGGLGQPNTDAAYLFDSNTGALLQSFPNPAANGGYFGGSLALKDNKALIGAQYNSTTGSVVDGAAYLF